MTKNKKLMLIFAIMLMALVAAGCVFMSACERAEMPEGSGDVPEDQCVVKVPTSDDASYLVFDDTNAFEDSADLSIVSYDGIYYTVNGTSSTMTEEIAEWFGGEGYATAGDQYVVIKIAVAEGETITYGHDASKSYTNGGESDDNFYNGYHFIVYKLTFDEDGICTSEATYTVTDGNGIETEYTISFSGVTISQES